MNLPLNVRPETPLDHPQITQIHELAFQGSNEAHLLEFHLVDFSLFSVLIYGSISFIIASMLYPVTNA